MADGKTPSTNMQNKQTKANNIGNGLLSRTVDSTPIMVCAWELWLIRPVAQERSRDLKGESDRLHTLESGFY